MTERERFAAKVDTTSGLGPKGDCHVWRGFCDPRGNARLGFRGRRSHLARRVAWYLATGEWPSQVRQRCGNRACVRFEHLTDSPAPRASMAERFEAKVDRSPGLGPQGTCHLWIAALQNQGYGTMRVDGRLQLAHRVAWRLATGEWPSALILHHCDTPACVREEHLFMGTQSDNMLDMVAKGRRRYG